MSEVEFIRRAEVLTRLPQSPVSKWANSAASGLQVVDSRREAIPIRRNSDETWAL